MNITFTIPDDVAQRVIDGVAYRNGYSDTLIDESTGTPYPNPISKGQFAKEMILQFIKENVKTWEGSAAYIAAKQKVDSEIIIE